MRIVPDLRTSIRAGDAVLYVSDDAMSIFGRLLGVSVQLPRERSERQEVVTCVRDLTHSPQPTQQTYVRVVE